MHQQKKASSLVASRYSSGRFSVEGASSAGWRENGAGGPA